MTVGFKMMIRPHDAAFREDFLSEGHIEICVVYEIQRTAMS
jgi:hypothetical protein